MMEGHKLTLTESRDKRIIQPSKPSKFIYYFSSFYFQIFKSSKLIELNHKNNER